MGRAHVTVPVPALALKRAEAAASLGISVDVFDREVRPHVRPVRLGGVVVYRVAELEAFAVSREEPTAADQLRATSRTRGTT